MRECRGLIQDYFFGGEIGAKDVVLQRLLHIIMHSSTVL